MSRFPTRISIDNHVQPAVIFFRDFERPSDEHDEQARELGAHTKSFPFIKGLAGFRSLSKTKLGAKQAHPKFKAAESAEH